MKRETTLLVVVLAAAAVLLGVIAAGQFLMRDTGVQTPRGDGAEDAAAALPGRTRYDCLIIRNLSGVDDVVNSPGFPKVHRPDAAASGALRAEPSARRREQLMGTTIGVAVYDMPRDDARRAVEAAMTRVAELSRKLNVFNPQSDVSRVNREAHRAPVTVDDDLHRLIRLSNSVAELSGGAFDATVGPLTSLWRKHRRQKKLPPAEEIERARKLVGYRKVKMDAGRELAFTTAGMSFDFGGIAKGFAAEEAGAVLRKHGVTSAIIDCGGDLKVIGRRPGGAPFRVGVTEPRPNAGPLRFVVQVENTSIVTSGNYEQFTVIDGRRYSHIIDPRSGRSIAALPSVTVIGPDSGLCDALATAVSVLGEKEGLELIERVNATLARQ